MPREPWRIAVLLAIEVTILAAIPWRQLAARSSGQSVTLRTAPVDPFDHLSGYYVALGYEVEQQPSAAGAALARRDLLWITVERAEPAWRLVSVTREKPPPASGLVSLRAHWDGRRARIEGAGAFYVPEKRRREIEAAIQRQGGALVDLKVDEDGHVAPMKLRAGGLVLGQ